MYKYPISVCFEMVILFQTTVTKMPFAYHLHITAEVLDKGSDVDSVFFFKKVNTKVNPFIFVTTPSTNIPWTLPEYSWGQRLILFPWTRPFRFPELPKQYRPR